MKRRWLAPLWAWLKTHKHTIVLVILGLVWAQVISQLQYPADTALPRARVAGEIVRGKTRLELAAEFQKQFEAKKITIRTPSSSVELPLAEFGASIDADSMAASLTTYSPQDRLLPFSVLWKQPEVNDYTLRFNEAKLAATSTAIAKELSVAPINAALGLKKGELVVTTARAGQTVDPETISGVMKNQVVYFSTTTLQIASVEAPPIVADADIEVVKNEAEAAIARSYILQLPNGTQHTFTSKEAVGWLAFTKQNKLTVNKKAIHRSIARVNKKVYRAPIAAQATMVDGSVVKRTGGKDGVTIDVNDLTTKLTNALTSSEGGVAMDVLTRPVQKNSIVARSYTSSHNGLKAYVAYTTASENVRISVKQIGGKSWSAGGRTSESIPSASTYKLYVALWLFDQMNKGNIQWSDSWLDTTVSGCFDRMIIASTNPCAEAWLAKAGRSNVNNFIYGKGFSHGTSFTNPSATHTTAADLTKMMIGLNDGSLASGSQRTRLLSSLRVHPYRYGVPTGSKGQVEDKVGFLWDYVHDAAIVRHARGTYVMVIMTKGAGGYAKIAEITREIEQILYP